jgi:hypothetical protein
MAEIFMQWRQELIKMELQQETITGLKREQV